MAEKFIVGMDPASPDEFVIGLVNDDGLLLIHAQEARFTGEPVRVRIAGEEQP